MRAIVRIENLELHGDAVGTWWRSETLERALASLGSSPLWRALHFAGPSDGTLERFESSAELAEQIGRWKPKRLYRLGSEPTGREDVYALWSMREDSLTLRLVLRSDAISTRAGTLVDDALALVRDLRSTTRALATLGPMVAFDLLELPYPRPRPPRTFEYVVPATLFIALDRGYFEVTEQPVPSDWQALLEAALPTPASRSTVDGLEIVRWVEDVRDLEQVVRDLSTQERFLTDLLQPPIEDGFNAEGDLRVDTYGLAEDDRLTFFDAASSTGFKAMVAPGGHLVGEGQVADLVSWLEAGRLPDGRTLQQAYLILPNRSAALAVGRLADVAALTGVLYTDGDNLWDPRPPGPWIGT